MKKLLIIATGGTIASKESETGLAPSMTGEELLAAMPDFGERCALDVLQLMNIDSTDMRPGDWLRIKDAIMDRYADYDGFVILHGTDTLAYTAAALSYLIQESPKPIVLTGSQKPMASPYTDAKLNIYQSIVYALDPDSCEISIVFQGKVIAGTRARKQRTRSYNAFDSMNLPQLANIYDDKIFRYYREKKVSAVLPRSYDKLNERVFVLKLTPAVKADIFRLLKGHYDAIVLETFGIGGIPSFDDSFRAAIADWTKSGGIIAVTTQVPEEGLDLAVYQVGKLYDEDPAILKGGDMTTEAILAKLMWILGQTNKPQEIRRLFYHPINYDRQL